MKIQTVEYTKTFNLGNYSNHKIGLIASLGEDETAIEVFAELKKTVERSHQFFVDMPGYERAKQIASDPMSFTGMQVKQATEGIAAFEASYPDYIRAFVPASRTLTVGVEPEHYDD